MSDLLDMAVSDWMFDSSVQSAIPVYYSIVVLVASINLGEHSERKLPQMIISFLSASTSPNFLSFQLKSNLQCNNAYSLTMRAGSK